ncbi:MAG: DUF418 domain-containing protein [Hyphomonadaceae bacterium]
MADVAPVAEARRIVSLDVMRGFAVLGILIVNAAFFAAPWQASQNPLLAPLAITDDTAWAWFSMHVFFEYKCITLFSLLFGASLYLVGGERDDLERGAVLRRRLFWLLVFGLIHALFIWYGDILVIYALTGFLVLFVRSWTPRTLMIAGIVFYGLSLGLHSLFGLFFDHIPAAKLAEVKAEIWAPTPQTVDEVTAAYRGGLVAATTENMSTWASFIQSAITGIMVRTAGVMMIGMALFKWGFLSGNARLWLYVAALLLGGLALAAIGYQAWINAQAGFAFSHMQRSGAGANVALSIFVSIGYAALFVLLVKAGARVIVAPLAAVGRMAFTNYIAQSLVMTTIFWSGRGFGLFGEVDRITLYAIVLGVWIAQLIWSPLWLSRFEMGPLEWVWRRLSYKRPVRMARPA